MSPAVLGGHFSGRRHIALLAQLARESASGTLEISVGEDTAWVSFLAGHITWAETTEAQTGALRALVAAGVVSESEAEALAEESSDEDLLLERVAEEQGRSRAELEVYRNAAIRARVGRALSWGEGTWRFVPAPDASTQGIDPDLLPPFQLPRIAWDAARLWMPSQRVRGEVWDPAAGACMPGPGMDAALDLMELPTVLASPVRELLRSGGTPQDIAAALPVEPPALPQLLWVLEQAGWLLRATRRVPSLLAQVESAAESGGGGGARHGQAPALHVEVVEDEDSNSLLRSELAAQWASRRHDDFYDLLRVRPYASRSTIERAAAVRAAQWGPLAQDPSLPAHERSIAAALVVAVRVARATLMDEGSRETYDTELKAGDARRVADAVGTVPELPELPEPTGGQEVETALAEVSARLKAGDLAGAIRHVQRAYFLDASNPDVLAEYAWVVWKARDVAEFDETPEALLERAVRQDPEHRRAAEVRATIASGGQQIKRTGLLGWLRSRS